MKQHTPGPWNWAFGNKKGKVSLVHPHLGWLVVMDFARLGMDGAQPRFAKWEGDERGNMGGIMLTAKEMADSSNLADHPDARLIAAAPELLAACKLALMEFVGADWCGEAVDDLREAIALAEGK